MRRNVQPVSGAAATKEIKELSRVLAAVEDERLITRFLTSILTRNEIDALSSRWSLVNLLHQGWSQRDIAKQLGLSLCKITRGSRELKKRNSALKRIVDEHNRTLSQRPFKKSIKEKNHDGKSNLKRQRDPA